MQKNPDIPEVYMSNFSFLGVKIRVLQKWKPCTTNLYRSVTSLYTHASEYNFFLCGFSFTWHSRITGKQGNGEANFNSLFPLPPTSWTIKHYLGNYWRELTSAPLVSDVEKLQSVLSLMIRTISQMSSFLKILENLKKVLIDSKTTRLTP